jgi:general secretion pathway protein J
MKLPIIIHKRGFTLIEILIALFIFAIMATIATVALKRIFADKAILDNHIKQITALQMAVAIIRLDLTQAIDRPIRDQQGNLTIAFQGSTTSLTFTRTGNINPLGHYTMSNLQRITYNMSSGLQRSIAPVLDNAPHTKTTSRSLLAGAKNWHISYYNDKMQQFDNWPVPQLASTNTKEKPNPLPAAVDIKFTVDNLGDMEMLIPIYAGNLHKDEKDTNGATS